MQNLKLRSGLYAALYTRGFTREVVQGGEYRFNRNRKPDKWEFRPALVSVIIPTTVHFSIKKPLAFSMTKQLPGSAS